MREKLGVVVAAFFYYCGLVKLARWQRQHSNQSLIILNYHRANGGDLRRHLLYLRRHYRMLHLEEALKELYTPQKEDQAADQRTPLVLTFDDGYHDNYSRAFALVRELRIPITVFLIPGYIENGEYFWWQEGKRLVRRSQVNEVTIENHTYCLGRQEDRASLGQAIDTRLRYATSVIEREAFLKKTRQMLNVPESITTEEEATMPLTWEEVQEMEESGLVSFGAHTMHHPILAYLKDPTEVRHEVEECKNVLEQRLGHLVRTFAYPIGNFEAIGDEALKAVQEVGYTWAVTTVYGINTPKNIPYQLCRVSGDVSRHWMVMAAEVSGVWKFFSPLWKNSLFGGKLRGYSE